MKKSSLKATSLRNFMFISIIVIIIILVIGFYFIQDWMKNEAMTFGQTTSSTTATKDAAAVKKLQDEITKYQAAATSANALIASSQDYQSQTIQDLKKYASANNIDIDNYSFDQTTSKEVKSSVTINGVKSNFITITLDNSIQLTDLIKFLKSIETNTPKMQLSGINISPVPDTKGLVKVESLTIEIYNR